MDLNFGPITSTQLLLFQVIDMLIRTEERSLTDICWKETYFCYIEMFSAWSYADTHSQDKNGRKDQAKLKLFPASGTEW